MHRPLQVLVVCTANICRSPAATAYLRAHATERDLPIEVSSAGFLSPGEPASETMALVMGERGLDLSAHRSRVVDCEMVAAADLIVTMERRHGRELAARCGPQRVFTLKGLVAALESLDLDDADAATRLEAVDAGRLPGDLLGGGDDEIPDPFGKSKRVNRRTADELRDLTAALLDSLF